MTTYLFLCSRLGGGGAERQLQRVLNHADFGRYDIHLALTRDGGSYEADLDERITVHYLSRGKSSSTLALAASLLPLRQLIRQLRPAAVISFMDRQNMLQGLAGRLSGSSHKRIFCVQNAPSKSLANDGMFGQLLARRLPRVYNRADGIIAICQGVARDLQTTFGIKTPIDVIYNAGYDAAATALMREALPPGIEVKAGRQLVAVGRLTKQKGFDILLDSLALLKTPFSLWLLGRGEDEAALKAQAERLGLTDRVHFLGFQRNPYPFYRMADAFVLSSRWEGFGNVITEAMACGTAVVSTRCPFGPDEIITHEQTGLLTAVNDPRALAEGIERLLREPELRSRLAAAGAIRSKDFAADKISHRYFEVLHRIVVTA